MGSNITIHKSEYELFAQVCAVLVSEGIKFHANLFGDSWVIEFTGGF